MGEDMVVEGITKRRYEIMESRSMKYNLIKLFFKFFFSSDY